MGVDTYFMTMYGVKTDWTDEFSDAYEDAYSDSDDNGARLPHVVMDGMMGEYVVFGVSLLETESMRWEAPSGFVEVDINDLDKDREAYIKHFTETFPAFAHLVDKPWKVISFVHYS